MEPILTLEKITKTYPGVLALDAMDFAVHPGEVRALLGKNGAGKSTLVKILSGAIQPDSGKLLINGREMHFNSPRDAFEQGICTVYQEMSLVPGLTVAENITLGRWPQVRRLGVPMIDREAIRVMAQQSLDLLEVALDLDIQVSRLSVAQQQLVEIAKAISFDPQVLILDEPTSALAADEVNMLHQVVRKLAKSGRAIIYVTHRLQEVPHVADTVTVVRDGCSMGTIEVGAATPERIAHMMIGSEWRRADRDDAARAAAVKGDAPVILAVRGLRRAGVLEDINFELRAGEVLGVAGLLGSGRTELLRAIFGLDAIDAGEVWVGGEHLKKLSPRILKAHHVGMAPEDRKRQGLVLVFPVLENLTLASLYRAAPQGVIQRQVETGLAEDMVRDLQIKTASLGVKTRTLSGGNQQKVVIGNWLNTQPKVLILDEPTRGIDIQAKEQIFSLVRELAAEGMAVLFISSEIEEVLDVADRIVVMNNGRLTHEVTPGETTLENLLSLLMEEIPHG